MPSVAKFPSSIPKESPLLSCEPTTRFTIDTYTSAGSIPEHVVQTLGENQRTFNVIYPHIMKSRRLPSHTQQTGEFYFVCSTFTNSFSMSQSIELVMTCMDGVLGAYPIFICSTRPSYQTHSSFLIPCLKALASELLHHVGTERVFSVFALTFISHAFSEIWTKLTSVAIEPTPYYSAKLCVCTTRTLSNRKMTINNLLNFKIRPAKMTPADIDAVAELCFEFAETSFPFLLTRENAMVEAKTMIDNGLVWVHEVNHPVDQQTEIASIVCTTRVSNKVATITKVCTSTKWHNNGCAKRLVREVTRYLLQTKEAVVLYVAHDNGAARAVYENVGFRGFSYSSEFSEDMEDWVELGFDRTKVALGHW